MSKPKNKLQMSRYAPGFASKGRKIPARIVSAHMSDERAALAKELGERSKLETRAAKYSKKLNKPVARTEAERKELRRLSRDFRKQFASQSLHLPPNLGDFPSILSYSLQLAPTYAFGRIESDFSGTGNTASASRSTGEMALRFSQSVTNPLLHFSLVELGGFFFPPSGASHITVRANPITAFSWFMDSEGPRVFSDGIVSLKVVGFKGAQAQPESRSVIELWRENQDDEAEGFQFAVRTAAAMPMTTSLKLNNSDFYLISLKAISTFGVSGGPLNTEAFAIGSIAVSLPSVTLDVQIEPLLTQA